MKIALQDKKVVLRRIDNVSKVSCTCCSTYGLMYIQKSDGCAYCGAVNPDGDPCILFRKTQTNYFWGTSTHDNCENTDTCSGSYEKTVEKHRGTEGAEGIYESYKFIETHTFEQDCTETITTEYLFGTNNEIDSENDYECYSTQDSNGNWSGYFIQNGTTYYINDYCSSGSGGSPVYDCCEDVYDPEYSDSVTETYLEQSKCQQSDIHEYPPFFTLQELGSFVSCSGETSDPDPAYGNQRGVGIASAYNFSTNSGKNERDLRVKVFHSTGPTGYIKIRLKKTTNTYTKTLGSGCEYSWSYPATQTIDYIDYVWTGDIITNECQNLVTQDPYLEISPVEGTDVVVQIDSVTTAEE